MPRKYNKQKANVGTARMATKTVVRSGAAEWYQSPSRQIRLEVIECACEL
jgi:hypothetical protein